MATIVALMALVSLSAPASVVSLQQAVWADAARAPAPGIDLATLLLVAAMWTTTATNATAGLATGFGAGAGAVAVLSMVGRAMGAGWLTDAGAGTTEAGMALPSAAMILLLTVAVWRLDADGPTSIVAGWRRHRLIGGLAALLVPVVVVWVIPVPTSPARADYALTALLVVCISLLTQLTLLVSQHRDALAAIETMLDAAPEPTLFLTPAGTIVRANRAVAEAFGWSRRQLVNRSVALLVPGALAHVEDAVPPGPLARERSAVRLAPHLLTAVRRDGMTVPVELTVAHVRLRGRMLVAATVRDVSAHEQQLRELSDVQSLFMTAVSHELRTPLTVVMGIAETLVLHPAELREHQGEALLERLAVHARRLDVLLSDLLDLDRLQRGVFHAVLSLDVAGVVREQVARSASDLELEVRLEVTPALPEVPADPVLLPRVIDNLLTNAAKYAEGPVDVRVRGQEGGVLVVVDDRGPGVPPEMRDRVFEPFRRGDRVNAATPGVGIGLSLVAGVAAAANGRAWVQARDDGVPGASFRLFLPAAVARTITLGEADQPARPRPA